MFREFTSRIFEQLSIIDEKENIFSFSLSWKNIRTLSCLNENNEPVRIDVRFAFKDVTKEFLVDFIDYDCLFSGNCFPVMEYYIVYIGNFSSRIYFENVGEQFLIDKRCKTVGHKYVILENDPDLEEIIKNNYYDEFARLVKIEPEIRSSYISIDEKHFGLRSKGIEKKDHPDQPLISVIIPSFNSELIIEQALQSAIVQAYDNKEIIIIDGGSKDGTASIVKRYEAHIDLFKSEPDKNIFDAINKGTYLSKGMYSIFIGSDDLLFPDALESLVNGLAVNGQKDFFYGDFLNLHPNGRLNFIKTFIKSKKYGQFLIGHPALFIKKSTFCELKGFNDEYFICADGDFELKLITNNKKGCKINENICIFRGGGHSSFKIQNAKQVYKIFRKYDALNMRYYLFAGRMFLFIFFIRIFGNAAFTRLISLKGKFLVKKKIS